MSTDGRNYADLLSPYNVYYWVNYKRLGVAASRDLGVKLSKTPYFLLLDAHMRVYNALWLEDIVKLLSQDDRQLLCIQTKQLWKDDNGLVVELKDVAPVYGAYATFDKGVLSPGIEWNYLQKDNQATTQNIPCVLGAGYAASKRYWTHLLGLKGLKHYGSDEVYISLKVWLEGGKCVLLKEHEFGHIYREKAPYSIPQCSFVYNYLLIAYTLLPISVWCWVLSCCAIANPTDFKEAWSSFSKHKRNIEKLKKYYARIFTVSAQQVLSLSSVMSMQRILNIDRRWDIAQQLAQQIPSLHRDCYGIVNGKMSMLIWLTLWNRHNNNNTLQSIQYDWLESIKGAVFNHELPFNFFYGYCGIGWGLLFLYANQLLDDIDESILLQIDREIQFIHISAIEDKSLYYGTAGIVAYVVCRELYNRHKGYPSAFQEQFLKAIHLEEVHLCNTSREHIAVYYSNLHKNINNIVFPKDFKPKLEDWITYPSHLPIRAQFWEYSLDKGCLGYTLPIFLTRTHNPK